MCGHNFVCGKAMISPVKRRDGIEVFVNDTVLKK